MTSLFTDQQLLSLIAQDNRDAFEIIYRKYWNDLYNAAQRRLKNTPQAEDIVQEIFIRLWERRSDIQVENLSAYLHTSVRYRVYNYIARDKVSHIFYEPLEAIACHPVSADAVIIEKELQQLVDAYIEALPPKRKKIFALYFNEHLSTDEIAKRLKISQKTVQNQLGTAMNGIKAHLLPVIICLIMLAPVTK